MKILIVYIYKIIYNFLESENLTNTNRSVILGEFFFKEEYVYFLQLVLVSSSCVT